MKMWPPLGGLGMSDLALAALSFPLMLLLIFLRVPLAAAMLGVGFLGIWILRGTPNGILFQLNALVFETYASYSLSVIPLFLLMGQFATKGGMSRALFKAAEAFLGHKRGGVALASVGACAGFGAICGSSLATAATMGQVALPEMKRLGYSGALATGALAAGGTLGILIPPSVILVIYAILTEQNIAKLFIAALVPGVLAALGYMLTINLYARWFPDAAKPLPRASASQRVQALRATWPVMMIFLVVVGGIYTGGFNPTEGAAFGAIGTGILAVVQGGMRWRGLKEALLAAAVTSAMIYLIVVGAAVYNIFLANADLPKDAAAWVGDLVAGGLSPWWVLIAILLIYLFLGCVMDSLSMILLTIPVFFPLISGLDFGMTPEELALWFGVVVLITVEVGLITPPVGMNLFVINAMAKTVPIQETYRGALPFVASDLIRVVILVAAPGLTLGLVRLLW